MAGVRKRLAVVLAFAAGFVQPAQRPDGRPGAGQGGDGQPQGHVAGHAGAGHRGQSQRRSTVGGSGRPLDQGGGRRHARGPRAMSWPRSKTTTAATAGHRAGSAGYPGGGASAVSRKRGEAIRALGRVEPGRDHPAGADPIRTRRGPRRSRSRAGAPRADRGPTGADVDSGPVRRRRGGTADDARRTGRWRGATSCAWSTSSTWKSSPARRWNTFRSCSAVNCWTCASGRAAARPRCAPWSRWVMRTPTSSSCGWISTADPSRSARPSAFRSRPPTLARSLTVPRDALVLRPEGQSVFVVDANNEARQIDGHGRCRPGR